MMKKYVWVVFILILVLNACEASESVVQTAIAGTETARPTSTISPETASTFTLTPTQIDTPTIPPSNTPTLTPSDTPTETPNSTATPLPPLKNAMLTSSDLNQYYDMWQIKPVYINLFTENCLPNCADATWLGRGAQISIVLNMGESIQKAEKAVTNMMLKREGTFEFINLSDYDLWPKMPKNLWIGFKKDAPDNYMMMASHNETVVLCTLLAEDLSTNDVVVMLSFYLSKLVNNLKNLGY